MKKRMLALAMALCMTLSLLPTAAQAASGTPADGWYYLRAMNNYLNIDQTSGAELRDKSSTQNEAYCVENKGNNQITLKMGDGSYLGISDGLSNGTSVKGVNQPYLWNVYSESGSDIFSLRPSVNTKMVLNASDQKNEDGTKIILWTHENTDAPNNAEFRFIPTTATTLTAKPSTTGFVMSGKAVSVPEAYDLKGNNYLQLRGIAVLLNGTAAQFDVGWDGAYAVIEAGKPYTGTSNPATPTETTDVRKSATPFKLNSNLINFNSAYLIGGNTNYIQLREVAEALSGTASQFNVYWDGAAGKAVIVPGEAYTGSAPGAPKAGATASADKVDMTKVPAGSIKMGGRTVTISKPFYMGTFEVTQEQYKSVVGKNPSQFQGSGKITIVDDQGTPRVANLSAAPGETASKRPVDSVSWYNAIVFCNKLSMREGLTPAYRIGAFTDPNMWGRVPTVTIGNSAMWDSVEIVQGSTGYRLPTEAQWEYACRAGSKENYSTGEEISDTTGWYGVNSNSQTHEVGMKPANAFGLYDMHGNILELVWDWSYSLAPAYAQTDPNGSREQSDANKGVRMTRGGSYLHPAEQCTSGFREFGMFVERNDQNYVGFRVMRPDPETFTHTDKPTIEGMTWIPDGVHTTGGAENGTQKPVDGFYMSTYEVTQAKYIENMGSNPSNFKRLATTIADGESYNYRPVESISWYDAIVFCNKLSINEGYSPAYKIEKSTNPSNWGAVPKELNEKWDAVTIVEGSNGYRLPTDTQWEYACRAGTTSVYNNGKDTLIDDEADISNIVKDNTAWGKATSVYRDGKVKTHEVGFLPPNAFGLYDMHGNVCEWCWDESTKTEGNRIYRGGGYGDGAENLRSASRFSMPANKEKGSVGLRLVLPASAATQGKLTQALGTNKAWKTPLVNGWYKLELQGTILSMVAGSTIQHTYVVAGDGSQLPTFYIENKGNNIITIRHTSGRYVGVEKVEEKAALELVYKPFEWYVTFETGGIRPATDTGLVAIFATGYSRGNGGTFEAGTRISLMKRGLPTQSNNEVDNAKFSFYPIKAPGHFSWEEK